MPKKKIDKVYDKTFKKWISEKSEAIAFSQTFLPEYLSEDIDFETMKLENASFVDESLDEHSSDLVYSCEWKTGEKMMIDFIYEHKSYLPQYPEFQLLRYLYNGYNYQIRQGIEPNPVVCVVLYHGKETWTVRNISDYFALQAEKIKQFIPNFKYVLVDLADYSDEDIMAIEAGFLLRSIMLLFKHKDDPQFVLQNTEKLFIFVEEDIAQERIEMYFELVFVYIFEAYLFKKEEVKQIMDTIPNILRNKATNTYEMLVQEGAIIGEERGIVRGQQFTEKYDALKSVLNSLIAAPELTDKQIALIVGTNIKFVEEVKEGFGNGKRVKAEKVVQKIFKDLGKLSAQENQRLELVFQKMLPKFQKGA